MARHPEPWYWTARDAWYACIQGKQRKLAEGPEGKSAAWKVLRKILAELDRPRASQRLVGNLVALWSADVQARAERGEVAAQTPADYQRRLGSFPDACGAVAADQFRPHHLTTWLNEQEGWGATSRHDAVGAIKTMFAWAEAEGLIERSPVAHVKRPTRPKRREHVMGPEVWLAVRGAVRSPHFLALVEFLYLTGCRPKEARTLEACHVHLDRGVAILEGKTTRATGRKIVIRLSAAAAELLRPLVTTWPTGPLFRNEDGNPWTRFAVNDQVKRIRTRLKLDKDQGRGVVVYALRHLFARDGIQAGAGIVEMSVLLNHSSPRMLFEVYGDMTERSDHLQATLATVRPGPAPSPSPEAESAQPSSSTPAGETEPAGRPRSSLGSRPPRGSSTGKRRGRTV